MMDDFIYFKFIQLHNEGQLDQSYNQIRDSLKREGQKLNMEPFYKLLEMGIIDSTDNNRYGLANTVIIGRNNSKYLIGINLTSDLKNDFIHSILWEKLGLTLIKRPNINVEDNRFYHNDEIEAKISRLISLPNIIRKWKPETKNFLSSSLFKEIYQENKWMEYNGNSAKYGLFKVYRFNDNYYDYLFCTGNNQYIIKRSQFDAVRFFKMNISKPLFEYDLLKGVLRVSEYNSLPIFLKRIFLTEHLFNNGIFSENNCFKIQLKTFKNLSRNLQLNYKLI